MNFSLKNTRPRGIYLLPNLFTICSFFAGFFSIISSFAGNYDIAALSIFIAMISDSLDGRIARLTNTMTSFGAELDSLADMVSFAVAPACFAYAWSLSSLGKFGWLSAFIYMVAVALRLARFNTQLGNMDKKYFQGIPCPAAAAIITSFIWVCLDFDLNNSAIAITLSVITIVVGILMVSNIRFRSFKDVELRKNVPFVVILMSVLIIVLIIFDPSKVLFALFATYAISGPVATIWELQKKKRLRKKFLIKRKTREQNKS